MSVIVSEMLFNVGLKILQQFHTWLGAE